MGTHSEFNRGHFHDLRHEATSRFFEMGLDTMEVAAITGHETLQMLKRYTHIKTRRLVDRMAWPDDAARSRKDVAAPTSNGEADSADALT